MKNISKADLLALVNEVKQDLKGIAEKEAARLSKADAPPMEGSSGSSGSASPEGSSSEGSSSASPGGDVGAPPGAPPDASAAPPAGPEGSAPPPGPEGSAPPPGAPGEGAPPAGPSFEEMVSLYTSLAQSSPQDFEMHVQAIQAAMQQLQGGAGAEGSAPPAGPPGPDAGGAPPPGPSAAPAGPPPSAGPAGPPPSAGPEQAFKSEVDVLKADLKKAQEETAALGKVVESMLTMPQRKAVTGLTFIPYPAVKKSEGPAKKAFGEMTEAEVKEGLKVVTASPKLTKSDRDLINGYLLNPKQFKVELLESVFAKV